VVVDHVENDRHFPLVAGVHELFEPLGASVTVLHREGIHSVVPPVPAAGELGNRHQFYRRDTEVPEIVEPGDDGVEGTFRGEGPHVHLVKNIVFEGKTGPLPVLPGKGIPVDDLGGAVDALGLEAGGGIGALLFPVQPVQVESAGRSLLRHTSMVPVFLPCKRYGSLPRGKKANLHAFRLRGVDEKFTPFSPRS
jgi:hypothetical protein